MIMGVYYSRQAIVSNTGTEIVDSGHGTGPGGKVEWCSVSNGLRVCLVSELDV